VFASMVSDYETLGERPASQADNVPRKPIVRRRRA
jgi:hypothetical protein